MEDQTKKENKKDSSTEPQQPKGDPNKVAADYKKEDYDYYEEELWRVSDRDGC